MIDNVPVISLGQWAIGEKTSVERNHFFALEESLSSMPQVDVQTVRTVGGGMLAQEIRIPKGTTLTGQIHKKEHLNIVVSGLIAVATEDGEALIDARYGPVTLVSRPGTKRAGHALEDTVWITLHTFDESMTDDDIVTNDAGFKNLIEG